MNDIRAGRLCFAVDGFEQPGYVTVARKTGFLKEVPVILFGEPAHFGWWLLSSISFVDIPEALFLMSVARLRP